MDEYEEILSAETLTPAVIVFLSHLKEQLMLRIIPLYNATRQIKNVFQSFFL